LKRAVGRRLGTRNGLRATPVPRPAPSRTQRVRRDRRKGNDQESGKCSMFGSCLAMGAECNRRDAESAETDAEKTSGENEPQISQIPQIGGEWFDLHLRNLRHLRFHASLSSSASVSASSAPRRLHFLFITHASIAELGGCGNAMQAREISQVLVGRCSAGLIADGNPLR